MSEFDREFGWDDEIQNDSSFVIVPEGDYNFRVINFQRGRHGGSDKLPPCNKAILTIELWNGANKTTIDHNIFLHTKTEGLLCEFFTAIGQRKHGEKLRMNWDRVIGSTGTCKVGIRKYNGSDYNDIKKFYEKGHGIQEMSGAPASAAPQTSYQAGQF